MGLATILLGILALPVVWYYNRHVSHWKSELAGAVLFALGLAHLALPAVLAFFLLGSHEYRMWILQGPAPFKFLGSGPLLVWLGLYSAFMGYGLVALSLKLRNPAKGSRDS